MPRCLCTLTKLTAEGYTPAAARLLAGGARKFPHRLTFNRKDVVEFRVRAAAHMSISGVQDKVSLRLQRGELLPTETDGEYILKPVPSAAFPRLVEDIPANEHLTMQIAGQIFGMGTAVNACIRFADGELAYITKRFDRRPDGTKIAQEDFCQLSNRSQETKGDNYKYDGSYEEVGRILKQFCKAYPVEVEKLFARVLFNYVFSNGDAHLKNFSLFQTHFGDYVFTPAYDLLATTVHLPNESRSALDLFETFETDSFKVNGFYKRADFLKLGASYGMEPQRVGHYLDQYTGISAHVRSLVSRSLLSKMARKEYLNCFEDRMRAIQD